MAAVAEPPHTGDLTRVTLDQTGSYPDYCAEGAWHSSPAADVYCTFSYDGLVSFVQDYGVL